jgi:hypothetical protein
MHRRRLIALVSGILVAGTVAVAGSSGSPSATAADVEFSELGRYDTGAANADDDVTAAEIVAYEDDTMYVTSVGKIDVVDISDPSAPALIGVLPLPGDPTSVAVDNGLVAVSVPANPRTEPGQVLFFQEMAPVGAVTVGALPDMVTFTPDGKTLMVANEGEPNSYNQPDSVDPEGSISLIDTKSFRTTKAKTKTKVKTISFADFNVGNKRNKDLPADVRITGPNATVAQDLEPEYITVSPDGKTAWVSLQENNALAIVKVKSAKVDEIVALGTKDYSLPGSGFDASDRDGAINIANWSVKGFYMPDGIANYEVGRKGFVVTANEGDAREYTGFEDVDRAADVADLVAIPDAADDAKLGRLNVVTSAPVPRSVDGVTELFALGGRSFSIWSEDGDLVWDSGDDFERITAARLPRNFNASNSNNNFDNRSDDKGPEPENVVVGKIDGRHYAFIGLERIGGVMVYDVTDPSAPVFQQYVTTRDFALDPEATDSGPEGLLFVPAEDSPTGSALVIVGNEVSGTVNILG